MGDAGSGFLGMVIGALAIQAAWTAPSLFWCWLILLGVFIVDATYTLIRRIARGEKFMRRIAATLISLPRVVMLAICGLPWVFWLSTLFGCCRWH